jgi:membrane-associated HD superfamily phosphohydrolase
MRNWVAHIKTVRHEDTIMSSMIVIASSHVAIGLLVSAIVLANFTSLCAVAIAWRKERSAVSTKGIMFGITGLLLALGLSVAIDWEFADSGLYGLTIAAPFPISVVGITMGLWRKSRTHRMQ